MIMRRLVLALLPAAALVACGEATAPRVEPITELPRDLSPAELRVIEGSNAFAFELLGTLLDRADGDNVFASPLSASMAFGMAMNGAEGDTWAEMRDVLGFDGLSESQINGAYQDLIALLLALDPTVAFGLGNSLWVDDELALLPDFVARVGTHFDAEARTLDFADPATRAVINAWVSDVTSGRIDELLESIPPDVIMYLVNAVYFKGDWRTTFDRERTAPAPFTTLAGDVVQVPMMAGEVGYRVLFREEATVAELPYGGGAFTAVAVLPPEGESVAQLVESLDPQLWAEWMAALAVRAEGEDLDSEGILVRLPKIELEWGSDLIEPLRDLGMIRAFDWRAADFSRLTGGRDLYIQQALQKTFLKVDEEGTEAAAATAVGFGPTSAPPAASFDRPFILAIRERLSGTILFLGVIADPSA